MLKYLKGTEGKPPLGTPLHWTSIGTFAKICSSWWIFIIFLPVVRIFCGAAENVKKNFKKKSLKKFFFKFLIFKKKNFLKFWRKFFFGFFFEFFFTFSAAPQKIRTTGKKIMKIHQLEQILENFSKCPHDSPFWFAVGGEGLEMCVRRPRETAPPPQGVFGTFPIYSGIL